MNLSLVTPTVSDLISLAEAKENLRIISSDHDSLITRLITGAREWIEGYTGLSVGVQTWELRLDCFPAQHCAVDVIDVPKPPLLSVSSVKYNDTGGVEQTLSA